MAENVKEEVKMEDIEIKEETQEKSRPSSTVEDFCNVENTCTAMNVCTVKNTCTAMDVCTVYAKDEDFIMKEEFNTEETEGKP